MLALVPGLQKASAATDELAAPVANPQLVRSYVQPTSDYSAGHRGVDYRVSLGQDVLSPATGTVWFAGKVVNRGVLTLKVDASGALVELEPVCATVGTGDAVLIGQRIGSVCDADQSYRQHCQDMRCLHFSYRIADGYLSPIWVMGKLRPSQLLPWTDV
jgi:septal ring factor EnvC (AmiA/AmiB activator)